MHEFDLIKSFYGNRSAKRSGVPLINHIKEGLLILEDLGASKNAKGAFCLHPIFQADEALVNANKQDWSAVSSEVLILVLEYRKVANAYLSFREITDISEIELSPLREVNLMLIADKVQNRKDFEKYHKGSHPRSNELDAYFKNWLTRLGISEERYEQLKHKLEVY